MKDDAGRMKGCGGTVCKVEEWREAENGGQRETEKGGMKARLRE